MQFGGLVASGLAVHTATRRRLIRWGVSEMTCPDCYGKTFELAYFDDDEGGYRQVDGAYCPFCQAVVE